MKKFIASCLLIATLSNAPVLGARDAEAGMVLAGIGVGSIIYGFTGAEGWGAIGSVIGGMMAVGAGVVSAGIGGIFFAFHAPTVGWVFLILDEKSQTTESFLADALGKRFPEIQDRAVLAALAREIESRSQGVKPAPGETRVITVDEATVRAILAPTGLEESDPTAVSRVVQGLG